MFSKNQIKLSPLYDKPYFTVQDVANLLDFKLESSRVFCSRYTKNGIFIKLKNNYYSFTSKWQKNSQQDFFQISSALRVPSYISLLSALSYYGITTQIPNSCFENITLRMRKEYNIKGVIFRYYKINKNFFRNFLKKEGFFIAEKEKAFLDAIYLYSFGKYSLDFDALDISKLDLKRLKTMLKGYPSKTIKIVKKICKI